MSKAFTRESDVEPETELPARESQLPPGARNYVTRAGAARMQSELERLRSVDRVAALATANTEATDAARRKLHELDRRIRVLQESLAIAEVIDPSAQDPARVLFGARVTVRDENDREHRFHIVGIDEADAPRGRISWLSPLAKLLLGHAVDDTVTFHSPRGHDDEYTIVAIEYPTDYAT